jgi:hypothetical protein
MGAQSGSAGGAKSYLWSLCPACETAAVKKLHPLKKGCAPPRAWVFCTCCKPHPSHTTCSQALLREHMRNSDRALSNIEAMPEGFNTLRRMFETVQVSLQNGHSDLIPFSMRGQEKRVCQSGRAATSTSSPRLGRLTEVCCLITCACPPHPTLIPHTHCPLPSMRRSP